MIAASPPCPRSRSPRVAAFGAPAAAVLGLALALTGCHGRQQDQFAQAVDMGERPVAMKGVGKYFGGELGATVTISRGVGRGLPGGGKGRRRGGRETDESAPDLSGMDQKALVAYLSARGALGSPLPPVTIRLRLENHGKQIVQVDITDFNSYLGDFAVEPELLSLAPGQDAEPEPMISQLGVTSDVIPFKVTLQAGGKAETQTILVNNLADSADAAAAH